MRQKLNRTYLQSTRVAGLTFKILAYSSIQTRRETKFGCDQRKIESDTIRLCRSPGGKRNKQRLVDNKRDREELTGLRGKKRLSLNLNVKTRNFNLMIMKGKKVRLQIIKQFDQDNRRVDTKN